MKALLRVLPLALGLPLVTAEESPGIFAPKPPAPAKTEAPPAAPVEHLLSERLRQAIAARAAALTPANPAAPANSAKPITAGLAAPEVMSSRDVIVMERMIVQGERRAPVEQKESWLTNFQKTGIFYYHKGPTFTTQADIGLVPVKKTGIDQGETFFRFEIAFRLSW